MSQYFDEPPDVDLYPVCLRKIRYKGKLVIPFRNHFAKRAYQRVAYEKWKHCLISNRSQ
jgi:hypothetical protein